MRKEVKNILLEGFWKNSAVLVRIFSTLFGWLRTRGTRWESPSRKQPRLIDPICMVKVLFLSFPTVSSPLSPRGLFPALFELLNGVRHRGFPSKFVSLNTVQFEELPLMAYSTFSVCVNGSRSWSPSVKIDFLSFPAGFAGDSWIKRAPGVLTAFSASSEAISPINAHKKICLILAGYWGSANNNVTSWFYFSSRKNKDWFWLVIW